MSRSQQKSPAIHYIKASIYLIQTGNTHGHVFVRFIWYVWLRNERFVLFLNFYLLSELLRHRIFLWFGNLLIETTHILLLSAIYLTGWWHRTATTTGKNVARLKYLLTIYWSHVTSLNKELWITGADNLHLSLT